jgi:hypothetical protein
MCFAKVLYPLHLSVYFNVFLFKIHLFYFSLCGVVSHTPTPPPKKIPFSPMSSKDCNDVAYVISSLSFLLMVLSASLFRSALSLFLFFFSLSISVSFFFSSFCSCTSCIAIRVRVRVRFLLSSLCVPLPLFWH